MNRAIAKNLYDFFINASDGMLVFTEDKEIVANNKSILYFSLCGRKDLSGIHLS